MIGATCCPFHKVTALYQALSIINNRYSPSCLNAGLLYKYHLYSVYDSLLTLVELIYKRKSRHYLPHIKKSKTTYFTFSHQQPPIYMNVFMCKFYSNPYFRFTFLTFYFVKQNHRNKF